LGSLSLWVNFINIQLRQVTGLLVHFEARCPHARIGVSARIAVSEKGNDAKFTMSDEVKNDQIPISNFSDTALEKSEIGIRNRRSTCRGIHIQHFFPIHLRHKNPPGPTPYT
jgi:hypothetical protein